MAAQTERKYDRNSYLFQDILKVDPEVAENCCSDLLSVFRSLQDSRAFKINMDSFTKRQCLMLVWLSDKFEKKNDSRLAEVDEAQTYKLLSGQYDNLMREISASDMTLAQVLDKLPQVVDNADAEEDRFSRRQMEQYMLALIYLFDKARKGIKLSEELIKSVHHILMAGLKTAERSEITAGEYRECSVTSGSGHMYIDPEYVPKAIPKMVEEFNVKKSLGANCDMFERASWLLFELLSIHPFVDGNGRLSRLFWCYSLILDGLPFPVSPFAGLVSKPYNHYVKCIVKDESALSSKRRNLMAMTLITVYTTWRNFASNLKYENFEAYIKVAAAFNET